MHSYTSHKYFMVWRMNPWIIRILATMIGTSGFYSAWTVALYWWIWDLLAHKTGRALEGEEDAYVDYVHRINIYNQEIWSWPDLYHFPPLSNLLPSLHVGLTTYPFILLSKLWQLYESLKYTCPVIQLLVNVFLKAFEAMQLHSARVKF
jgi:hypothetical protein